MTDLSIRAELEKLALALGCPVNQLDCVAALDVAALRRLRGAVSAALFDRHAARFKRLADSTRLLPNRIVAIIAEKAIGPTLSAQIAGLIDPDDAEDLATRLPVPFQADICIQLDPRRAGPMLRAMPVEHVVTVAMELQRREAFIAMARFVDDLNDEQIDAVSRRISPEALLQVGFYVESAHRLEELVHALPPELLAHTLEAAAARNGQLWPQAVAILTALSPEGQEALIRPLAEKGKSMRAELERLSPGWDELPADLQRRLEAVLQ